MNKPSAVFSQPVSLTQKQRDVLDLLIRHMSSKQIARELGISPHTVDQRVRNARRKFGASSRAELAVLYRTQMETYESPVYQSSHVASDRQNTASGCLDDTDLQEEKADPIPIDLDGVGEEVRDYRVVPDLMEGRHATLIRLVVISIIALLLIVIVLGGMAIFGQVSDLLSS